MDAKDVAQFLRSNPHFFDQNPQLLESIYVPHPHGGRAIPLTERQIVQAPDLWSWHHRRWCKRPLAPDLVA